MRPFLDRHVLEVMAVDRSLCAPGPTPSFISTEQRMDLARSHKLVTVLFAVGGVAAGSQTYRCFGVSRGCIWHFLTILVQPLQHHPLTPTTQPSASHPAHLICTHLLSLVVDFKF